LDRTDDNAEQQPGCDHGRLGDLAQQDFEDDCRL
jgi:hypothetical protein